MNDEFPLDPVPGRRLLACALADVAIVLIGVIQLVGL